MDSISTERELLEVIADADRIGEGDYARKVEFLNSVNYTPSGSPPNDPNSSEYREWQLSLWREISGRSSYDPQENELDKHVTTESGYESPFPYCTGSSEIVGNYVAAIGSIIKALGLKPKEKVIEFGVGWAHTTINLAKCGYVVTALDIEKKFLDILARRANEENLVIETIHGTFLDLPRKEKAFNAALFFECFHHCIDFNDLLTELNKILVPGGRIVFCGETFYDDWFWCPWGVRLDGHSIWAIRSFGWMELGFRDKYVVALLEKLGFTVEKSDGNIGSVGKIYIAQKPRD